MVWYSQLFNSFPQFIMIHTLKGFDVVDETEDVFLEFPSFLYDPVNVGNSISGSSSFSNSSLDIWKFLVHILLKPSLENFEHYLASAATKSLQSCPTLCNSIDGSSPDSPVSGILQARTLEWVAISFSNA